MVFGSFFWFKKQNLKKNLILTKEKNKKWNKIKFHHFSSSSEHFSEKKNNRCHHQKLEKIQSQSFSFKLENYNRWEDQYLSKCLNHSSKTWIHSNTNATQRFVKFEFEKKTTPNLLTNAKNVAIYALIYLKGLKLFNIAFEKIKDLKLSKRSPISIVKRFTTRIQNTEMKI